jgi:hypothetical protein
LKLFALAALVLAAAIASASSAKMEFWSWFAANEDRLYNFERDQEAIFDELARELHRVHPDLTFEFGPEIAGARDFVVSAGGIKAAFPAVEALVVAAPKLPKWRVVAFRPRRSPLHDIQLGGVSVKAGEVRFSLIRHDGRIGVLLFLPGYSEAAKTTYGQIGYLLLDEALGEYDVEMKVGVIEFHPLSEASPTKSYPLEELAEFFDQQHQ